MICSWCRKEYSMPVLFHICADGTTFYDRSQKTSEEFDAQNVRLERIAAGIKAMKEVHSLPNPVSPTEWIVETYNGKIYSEKITDYDYKMLRGMKISLKEKP